MKSPRRRAREFALQGLYQALVAGHDAAAIEGHMTDVAGFEKADKTLFIALLRGTLTHRSELEQMLAPFADRPVAEISPIERAVLLLAAFEFAHQPETPYRVVINEAIELAKSFGSVEGHKYVNGVLDKLAQQVRAAEIAVRRRSEA